MVNSSTLTWLVPPSYSYKQREEASSLAFKFSASCTFTFRASFYCIVQSMWGPLSWVPQLMEDPASSPTCLQCGQVVWGRAGGVHLSPTHNATWQRSNEDTSPMLTASGLAHPHLHHQGRCYCAAQAGCRDCSTVLMAWGPRLPLASVIEEWGGAFLAHPCRWGWALPVLIAPGLAHAHVHHRRGWL